MNNIQKNAYLFHLDMVEIFARKVLASFFLIRFYMVLNSKIWHIVHIIRLAKMVCLPFYLSSKI